MAQRVLTVATWFSVALLGVTLLLAVASFWINPWDHRLPFADRFHVGVWRRGWDIRLVFFNDAEYGPYHGSIIQLADEQGNLYPPLESDVRLGDTAGVYFRYFRWADATLWTFMVFIWYPAAVFAILPAYCWIRRFRTPPQESAAPNQ